MFNTLTGAMADLTDYVWEKIDAARNDGGVITGISPNLEERLLYGGFIVDDDTDEVETVHLKFDQARSSRSNLTLTICPTLACNLQCNYCFESGTGVTMKPEVEDSIAALVEERMQNGLKTLSVTWYGGEPLLAKEVVIRLSRRLGELAEKYRTTYSSSMITNGTLLDPETYANLREAHVNRFQVTIDGPGHINDERKPMKDGSGSFTTVCKNLYHIREIPNRISIRVNTDRSNRSAVIDLAAYFVSNGMERYIKSMYASPVILWPQGRCSSYYQPCYTELEFGQVLLELDDEMYERFGVTILQPPTPHFVSCASLNPTTLVIGPEGELYKCWNDVGMPEYHYGHIMYQATNPGMVRYWSIWSPFKSDDCRRCILLPVCGGGCPSKPMRGLETVKGHACIHYKLVFGEMLRRIQRSLSTKGVERCGC